MTLAVDATTATFTETSGAASVTISNLTVGSGSQRGLACCVVFFDAALPSGLALTWDNGGTNQAMTQIPNTSVSDSGNNLTTVWFGLVAPTSGNKNLLVSWTGTLEAHACAISFTGMDQTSVAVAFPHGASNNGSSATASVTITSASGNLVLSGFENGTGDFLVFSGTKIADSATGPSVVAAASYNNGAATVTQTATLPSGPWIACGCDVLAAAAAAIYVPSNRTHLIFGDWDA